MGKGGKDKCSATLTKPSPQRRARKETKPLYKDTPWTESQFNRYCDRLLDGAGVKEGDLVTLELDNAAQRDMVDGIFDAAVARNAQVIVLSNDEQKDTDNLDQEIERLLDDRGVLLGMMTYSGPDSKAAIDRVDLFERFPEFTEAYSDNKVRWNYSMWPSQEWAEKVYPELEPDQAYRNLGQDLLNFARCGNETNEDWQKHVDRLHQRAQTLNELDVKELHFSGGGTDLKMSPAEGAKFVPCQWETDSDKPAMVCANTPTEEVFTTPDPFSSSGTIRSTKPLVIGGVSIEGIEGRLENGRLVQLTCADPKQQKILDKHFCQEDGTQLIGEVGLVDQQTPIAQSGRTYHNNVLDENGGIHLGFGMSYNSITGGAGNPEASGANHLDMVIGSEEIRVSALTRDGKKVTLMENGSWQI
jgi:aminopeptidase